MNRKLLGFGGLGIALLLLLSINVLAGAALRSARVDLTEEGLFTLSEGSKAALSKIQEPVTLRLYFSATLAKDYPPLPGYAQRVEDLLREYSTRSGGQVRVEVLDPEPFTETEDEAVRYGLQGVPLPGNEGSLYFGLAGTNSLDDVEVIPFFQPDKETFLEYELTKLVYRLANPERPTVGVLAGLPVEGQMGNPMTMREMPQPWVFMEQVRQLYETRTLQPSMTEVPAEVDVLLVVHPKALPDTALYAIDQFVLGGGKLFAFVDPFCEADVPPQDPNNPMASMMAPRGSDLDRLFEAWGVRLVEGQLAGDLRNALKVNYPGRQGREESVSYVLWLSLREDALAEGEVVTDGLSLLNFGTPGILEPLPDAGTEFTPLVQTSPDSEQVPVSQIQFGPDPAGLLATYFSPDRPPIERRFTLAARLSGEVQSAFPDGKPAAPDEADQGAASAPADGQHRARSEGSISVVLVSDCDMLADRWWARPINFAGTRLISKTADNGDLVINVLDLLGGSTDLISLRGRGASARPFTVVEDLQREAEAKFRAEEQRLLDEQTRVEQRLNELLTKQEGQGSILITPEVEAEIERLREEQVKTRGNLRKVRRDLNKDVERLGARIKWINIAAIPLLVGVTAVGLASTRRRRRGA